MKKSNQKSHILKPKKISFKDMDKVLFFSTIILIVIGILSIVSASSRETVARYNYSVYHYFYQHMFMITVGLILGGVILLLDTKFYKILGPVAWLTVFGLLVGMFVYGAVKRGSLRWIELFGFRFQPSEFAKLIIIIMIAIAFDLLNKRVKRDEFNKWTYTGIWLVLGIIMPVIVFLQGDLGTALIMALIAGVMYLSGPLDKKKRNSCIGTLILLFISAMGILYMTRGYILSDVQKQRITDFYNPCSKYEEYGFQMCNGLIAINDGGVFGVGIGKSKQKYSYIPDPHTDSIFAIIVEEGGLVMGVVILILYFIIIQRILKISSSSSTERGKYIAFGVAVYAFAHIMANLGGLLAIMPLTGVPLPLISYGGSFTITFLCSLAMVQRIGMEEKYRKRQLELKKEMEMKKN